LFYVVVCNCALTNNAVRYRIVKVILLMREKLISYTDIIKFSIKIVQEFKNSNAEV